jgi:hypothetical protein
MLCADVRKWREVVSTTSSFHLSSELYLFVGERSLAI